MPTVSNAARVTVADIAAVSAAMPSSVLDERAWAGWQDQLADLWERIAAEGGPDAEQAATRAAGARAESARVRAGWSQ
ncbi:hypothetical protein NCC78_04275 [Micromonospora phytophila]|uniref:hypothetical protein n=1 Tax=Micromonospora phytophila TaxID=709888 RepID=UPI002030BD94|nr:hypothetical protein [Micromonospora phytophila]MCM0673925.1 hypothetical protein [Micromonospora phytophila]